MKKLLSFGLVAIAGFALTAGLASCGSKTAEIALITDVGDIDDKSFNQGAWEGVKEYAKANKKSHQYYKPAEKSTTSYVETIELAIQNGAKVVVTPGFLFEEPIFLVQDRFPEVHFVLLDGAPHNADYSEFKTGKNVQSIVYAEEQAGYLAGYGAVKDGYTKLGFMGGMAVPAVVRFGLGYLVGANDAATELNVDITVNYHYTGNFNASPEAKAKATTWYQSGVEVIFACGGAVGQSVMAAAQEQNKKVIGVDVDQSGDSATVITSATKGLAASVVQALTAHYTDKWEGGSTWNLDASKDGVGLPTAEGSWRFSKWTLAEYEAIFDKLADGTVKPSTIVNAAVLAMQPEAAVAAVDLVLLKVSTTFEA